MHLLKYFDKLSVKPENAKELKGLILDLAIRGRLTEDWRKINSDVETASDILERIKEDKERLIKEKKIKKEKPFPIISNDDIPYEIPDSWVWCRLIDICSYIQRGKSPKYSEVSKIPVISQKCVQWDDFYIERAKFIIPETLDKYAEIRYLQHNDLLWNSTGDGTVGRTILFPKTDYDIVVADSHVTVVRTFKQSVKPMYLWIFTACSDTQRSVLGRVSGSTKQTELGTGTVKSLLFPLPPPKEQKTIVQVVNQLMEEVDQLEAQTKTRVELRQDFIKSSLRQLTTADSSSEWKKLQPQFPSFFNTVESIDKLKEAILQLAVQGKLTKQWREEQKKKGIEIEHASALLQRIKEEKARLVKEKMIKKEKALPEITEEEIPFELPDGWVSARLGFLSERVSVGHVGNTSEYYCSESEGVLFLRSGNVKPGRIKLKGVKYITKEFHAKLAKSQLKPNDLLIVRVGANRGDTCLLPKQYILVNCANIVFARPLLGTHSFIELYFRSPIWQQFGLGRSKGSAQGVINTKVVKDSIVCLPSIKEQIYIVKKVSQLLEFCNQMKSEIENRNNLSKDFLRSSIREVIEKTKALA